MITIVPHDLNSWSTGYRPELCDDFSVFKVGAISAGTAYGEKA